MNAAVAAIVERVRDAHAAGAPLRIRGGGTQGLLRRERRPATLLDARDAARAAPTTSRPSSSSPRRPACTLAELEAQLAEHGQCLAVRAAALRAGVDGRRHGRRRALGAVARRRRVACATTCSASTLVERHAASCCSFGGRVIKNVAGYDVSRLVAGSLGILGVIVEVSLKVLPRAEAETTLRFDLQAGRSAARCCTAGAREPLPLDASAWWNGNLIVRLRGAPAAVARSARARSAARRSRRPRRRRSGRACATTPIRSSSPRDDAIEHQDATLWRLSLPQTAPLLGLAGDELIEWHGAQRWLGDRAAGGAGARRRRGGRRPRDRCFAAATSRPACSRRCAPPLRAIHERLKRAFDPKGILNPGRLYPGL